MLLLGVVVLILAALLDIAVLWTIGWILAGVGLLLLVFGMLDRSVGPARFYY